MTYKAKVFSNHSMTTLRKQVEKYYNEFITTKHIVGSTKTALCDASTIPNQAVVIYSSDKDDYAQLSEGKWYWKSYVYYTKDPSEFEQLVTAIAHGLSTGKLPKPEANLYDYISKDQAYHSIFTLTYDSKNGINLGLWYPIKERQ